MYIDLAERPIREIGAQDPVGRDADQGLEPGFRPVPGGAHHCGFRAAGHDRLHAGGNRGRPSPAGQAGDDVAECDDEVADQVQDRLEQVLCIGAAKNPAEPGAGDVERWMQGRHRCGARLPGRVATLARLSQGASLIYLYRQTVAVFQLFFMEGVGDSRVGYNI